MFNFNPFFARAVFIPVAATDLLVIEVDPAVDCGSLFSLCWQFVGHELLVEVENWEILFLFLLVVCFQCFLLSWRIQASVRILTAESREFLLIFGLLEWRLLFQQGPFLVPRSWQRALAKHDLGPLVFGLLGDIPHLNGCQKRRTVILVDNNPLEPPLVIPLDEGMRMPFEHT